jgi:hypothetical protein
MGKGCGSCNTGGIGSRLIEKKVVRAAYTALNRKAWELAGERVHRTRHGFAAHSGIFRQSATTEPNWLLQSSIENESF